MLAIIGKMKSMILSEKSDISRSNFTMFMHSLWSSIEKHDFLKFSLLVTSLDDLNTSFDCHGTLLMHAAKHNNILVTEYLINQNVELESHSCTVPSALYIASQHNHVKLSLLLIRAGAEINPACTSVFGLPLHVAAISGHTEMVNMLIENGADLNALDIHGQTALMKATNKVQMYTVEALLNAGADITLKDKEGLTAMENALRDDRFSIVYVYEKYMAQLHTDDS